MILCDIDGVLAFGPDGGDTKPGQLIYPTFRKRPAELETIRAAGIPLYIVTAKVEAEARQILAAIDLLQEVDGVVGADRLFWSTLALELSERRFPSVIRKSVSRKILPGAPGSAVVMIEDRRSNLEEMLDSGSIDLGILVPPRRVAAQVGYECFDLELALRLARMRIEGTLNLEDIKSEGVEVRDPGGNRGGRVRAGPPQLLEIPRFCTFPDSAIESRISPVGVLRGSRREVVSWVRTVLRWSRSVRS